MANNIILRRSEFFFNRAMRSSHVEFMFSKELNEAENASFNSVSFQSSNAEDNGSFLPSAEVSKNGRFYSVDFRHGKRKFTLYGTSVDGMDGAYTEDDSLNGKIFSRTLGGDTYRVLYDESDRKWKVGKAGTSPGNEIAILFESGSNAKAIPPHHFKSVSDEIKSSPYLIWDIDQSIPGEFVMTAEYNEGDEQASVVKNVVFTRDDCECSEENCSSHLIKYSDNQSLMFKGSSLANSPCFMEIFKPVSKIEKNDDYVQRALFSEVPEGFSCESLKFSFGTDELGNNSRFSSQLHGKYIVQSVITTDDKKWHHVLFEAVRNGKEFLTFEELKGIDNSFNPEGMADNTHVIVFNRKEGWWDVVERKQFASYRASLESPSDYNEVSKSVSGVILDALAYPENERSHNNFTKIVQDVKYGKEDMSSKICRYLFFKKSSEQSDLSDFLRLNGVFVRPENAPVLLMKGRLVSYSGGLATFDTKADFYLSKNPLVSFKLNGNPPIGMKSAEFVIHDPFYVQPLSNGNRMLIFDSIQEDHVPGDELMRILSRNNEKFLNDDYMVSAVSVGDNGLLSVPFEQMEEIAYFRHPLILEFFKEWKEDPTVTYVKDSKSNARISFRLKYSDSEEPDYDKAVLINGHRFSLSQIECSKEQFFEDIQSSGPFADYPYKWSEVKFLNDMESLTSPGYVFYDDSLDSKGDVKAEYHMLLPFGKTNLDPEKIVVGNAMKFGETFIGGKSNPYFLMPYNEVINEIRKYNEAGNSMNEFSKEEYVGYRKIYRALIGTEKKPYYIRSVKAYSYNYGDEIRWVVSLNPIAHDWIAFAEKGSRGDSSLMDHPEKALSNYAYQQDNYDYFDDYSSFIEDQASKYARQNEQGLMHGFRLRISDAHGNRTGVFRRNCKIHQLPPRDLSLLLIGSSGNRNYTGMTKRGDRFLPSEHVQAMVSASSEIGIKFRLKGKGMLSQSMPWTDIKRGDVRSIIFKTKAVNTGDSLLGGNNRMEVSLEVTDEAGNSVSVSKSIMYLTRMFRSKHQHLMRDSSDYRNEVGSFNGSFSSLISERVTSKNDYDRPWREIWYPENHGVPLLESGEIDVKEAIRISSQDIDDTGKDGPTFEETQTYDPLKLNKKELEKDTDGRYLQDVERWDQSKRYPKGENNAIVNGSYDKYWIIGNDGGDIPLEFEVFDFNDKNTVTIPANFVAPYDGDMLSVYDASDPGSVIEKYDRNGNKYYRLRDSSRLKHLFTLKGSCYSGEHAKFSIIDSTIHGNLNEMGKGFSAPVIAGCSRICLVPFSGYGESGGSGFKLKAGNRKMKEYSNYDKNLETGEFWVHIMPETDNSTWSSPEQISLKYRYYGSFSVMDFDRAEISFEGRQSNPLAGTFVVLSHLHTDGSCRYPYERFSCFDPNPPNGTSSEDINGDSLYFVPDKEHTHCLRDYAMTDDDLVDYSEPSMGVSPWGTSTNLKGKYEFGGSENNELYSSGRLSGGCSVNKDIGILSFAKIPPLGRVFADYYHHTFYRITSDGYGDLYFYGTGVVVPAKQTDQYKDWAYVDLKIVNEGTSSLQNGTLKFLARGYISAGSVVDTVLNMDRPWDVQEGTTAETVKRTGAFSDTSFSSLESSSTTMASRKNAVAAIKSQQCSLGSLAPKSAVYVRVFWCIANNADGTSWIDCTRGAKCFSAELSGKYYTFNFGG